ncbi:MAG: iron-containing alcohol dehydrogenase [Cellulosilyticaceae bacterium]
MLNFTFCNPTKIVFGQDTLKQLDTLIPSDARVLILYGGGSVQKFGTLDTVKKHLGNRVVFEFGGIEPNPQFTTLMRATALVHEHNITFLLAVGGGSVMDGTKFVSLASTFSGDAKELFHLGFVPASTAKGLPIGTVVTLPATGSEMNNGGVISSDLGKLPVFGENCYPVFSILDPTLTYTLPKTQVANGIIDTFIHTVEQYVTYPANASFQDRTAEGILKTLIEIGEQTLNNPTDYDARANLVWCATMALNGLIGAGVPQDWTTHKIGHELTFFHNIDHGKTLAILQPAIWDVRRKQKHDKLLQYAKRVWHITKGSDDEIINMAIDKTREFFESLGVKTHLADYGVSSNDFDTIINSLKKNGVSTLSETNDLTLDDVRTILEKAL